MLSDKLIKVRLTLISASPRRSELLRNAGYSFDIAPTHVSELWSHRDPIQLAVLNAEKKVRASDFFGKKSRLLIGADTIIAFNNQVFGKPQGIDSARRMLESLSGKVHQVITGICLSGPAPDSYNDYTTISSACSSDVTFHKLSNKTINDYVASGEWKGKAGAYAIQGLGSDLVQSLSGDYQNVVGLPISLLENAFNKHFSHCIFQP